MRPNDLDVTHAEVGNEKTILERRHHRGISHRFQLIERGQHASFLLIAVVDDGTSNGGIPLVGVRAQTQWVLLQKIVQDCQRTGVIQILFPGRGVALQRLNNLDLALIESLFAGLLNVERNQNLVVGGRSIGLHPGIFQSCPCQFRMDRSRAGGMHVLYVH